MNKDNKKELVKELNSALNEAAAVFVTDPIGLNVESVTKLRSNIRNTGGSYRVVKNTLLRRAVEGTPYESITDLFKGATAIAVANEDPVELSKVLVDYAKENEKLEVQGGALGDNVLSIDDIQALAELPGRDVLLGKMLGSLNAPATNFVGVFAAMLRQLVYVLKAIEDKKNQG